MCVLIFDRNGAVFRLPSPQIEQIPERGGDGDDPALAQCFVLVVQEVSDAFRNVAGWNIVTYLKNNSLAQLNFSGPELIFVLKKSSGS